MDQRDLCAALLITAMVMACVALYWYARCGPRQ